MISFDKASLALQAVCPNNVLLTDDKNMPSVMVKIPKMTYAQLGLGSSTATFPAFIVNGQEVDAIYISKYQNIIQNSRAYSLPGEDPKANITFDTARQACEAKGEGWHLMTRMEWMALALWCKANGTMPKGNNNYGKDSTETTYKAIPTYKDGDGKTCRVATGTGPVTWSHDGTPSGIWDLNGNVYEWVGGIRTVYGELQVLVNNNAADAAHSQAVGSAEWKAIDATSGNLVTPNGTGRTSNSLKASWTGSVWKWISGTPAADTTYHGCTLESVTVDSGIGAGAILMLQALGLYKYDNTAGAYAGDYIYMNVCEAERSFLCGGAWYGGSYAGVFYASGYPGRGYTYADIGFRSAYCELPS